MKRRNYVLCSIFISIFLIGIVTAWNSNSINIIGSNVGIFGSDYDSGIGGINNIIEAQTFYLPYDSSIKSLTLKLRPTEGAIGDLNVSINNISSNNNPNGTVIFRKTINNNVFSSLENTIFTVDFNNYTTLSKGNYAIILQKHTEMSNGNRLSWASSAGGSVDNPYSEGKSVYCDMYECDLTDYGQDFYFLITLNDSLEGNLTFRENQNITRYLSVPNSVSALTMSKLNLSSAWIEGANESAAENWYTGSSCNAGNPLTNAYDGDYGTTASLGSSYIYENFSSLGLGYNYFFSVRHLTSGTNTLASRCYDYEVASWVLLGTSTCNGCRQTATYEVPPACNNGIRIQVRSNAVGTLCGTDFYDDARVNYTSVINNSFLSIGDNQVWDYPNEFNQTNNRTSNFASTINQFLNATYLIGTNYIIPFIFHSDTAGILQYLDLTFNNNGFLESSQSYNSTTYETSSESFIINTTYDSSSYSSISGTLYYGGTAYAGIRSESGTSAIFTKTLDIPTITSQTNKTFYWTLTLTNSSGTNYFNTTAVNQTVSNIFLSRCGGAGGNVSYINFTFKDEATDTAINASVDLATWNYYLGSGSIYKTLIFTNTSVNPSYAFCFTPPSKSFSDTLTFQYASTGYPQRQYYRSGTLTNSTTNTVLYLLASGSGIYSSFQIVSNSGAPISGATVQVERQFSGVWNLISQSTSDTSGLVTFWLNPNYDHRLTVSKTGYPTTTVIIRPTQSIYSIVLSGSNTNGTYSEPVQGITYTKTPSSGVLEPGTYDFTFNVSASKSNIVNCKLELQNATKDIIISGISSGASNCYVSIPYTFVSGDTIYGAYYVDLGDGYIKLEGDANWIFIPTNKTSHTLKDFLSIFQDSNTWYSNDTEKRQWEFTKIAGFFLILALAASFANAKTQFDNINPGIFLFGLPLIMWIMSLAGGIAGHGFFYLEGATGFGFLDNYLLAFYTTLIAAGLYAATLRREG